MVFCLESQPLTVKTDRQGLWQLHLTGTARASQETFTPAASPSLSRQDLQ